MAQTPPPTITPAPAPAPQRGDRATFSSRVDAFVTWISAVVAQFQAVATNVYSNAVDAFNNATNAAASAATATSSAAAATVTANVSLWVSGAAVAQYASVISPANARTYRRKTATGSGVTDPSLDPTNYEPISVVPYALTLLATLTPTAAANVDFLTTFSGTYDNYLILGDGLLPATLNDFMFWRFANAGVVDTASNYVLAADTAPSSTTSTSGQATGVVEVTGQGVSFVVQINNANDATRGKYLESTAIAQASAGPAAYQSATQRYFYKKAASISGIRFYWSGAANFAATGKIRVYGYANS